MFEEIATSWPLDLVGEGEQRTSLLGHTSSLRELAIAARVDADSVRLQSALLARYAIGSHDKEDCEILYCWVAFNQLDYRSFDAALTVLRERSPSRFEVRVLTLLGWLWRNDLHSVSVAPSDIWAGQKNSHLLQLCRADFYLRVGELSKAENILSQIPNCISPEMAMVQASLCSRRGLSLIHISEPTRPY